MAYTYRGSFKYPTVSQSFWNGSSWSNPTISSGSSPIQLGFRQGIDPIATGSWDRRSVRINNVKLVREFRNCVESSFEMKPVANWGARISGNISAAYWASPSALHTSSLAWNDSKANYLGQKILAKTSASDFDAGVNLGELRETLEMLRSPLKGVRDFLSRTARRPSESVASYASRLGGASAQTWMEYRYGIRPLISTIEDLIDLYQKGLSVQDGRLYRKRGKLQVMQQGKTEFRTVTFSSFTGGQTITTTTSESYTGGVYYTYTGIPSAAEKLGIDMSALPGIAWELTRLSFVWDWFLGVGNWIESLRAELNRSIAGAYVSHKVLATTTISFTPGSLYVTGQPSWRVPASFQSVAVIRDEFMERRAISLSGFKLPAFNPNSLGLAKTIDSLILIWQHLPRR